MGERTYNFDALLNLKTAGAITASAAAQVSGANQILDVGAARFEAVAVINVTALDVADGNETYRVAIQGSNDATFATGVEEMASTTVTAAGKIELGFVNRKYGTQYRYLRAYTTIGGTTPSINYTAYATTVEWS